MDIYIQYIVFGFSAVMLAVVGIRMIYRDRMVKQNGRKTMATVIEVKEEKTRDGMTYKPVFEFQDARGKKIVQELDYASGIKPKQNPPYKTPIYYLTKNGKTTIVMGDRNIKLIMGYCFVGIGISILAVLSFIYLS